MRPETGVVSGRFGQPEPVQVQVRRMGYPKM